MGAAIAISLVAKMNLSSNSKATRTLLHISTSINSIEKSYSKKVAQTFVDSFKLKFNTNYVSRDLIQLPVDHLDFEGVEVETTSLDKLTESMKIRYDNRINLITELLNADDIIISTQLWNWGPPSILKAYIDQIVFKGLLDSFSCQKLDGKSITIIVACGGSYGPNSPNESADHLTPYLKTVFSKLGCKNILCIWTEFTKAGVKPGMESFIKIKDESFRLANEQTISRVSEL